jgi:ATP-dependent Clp protease ATP-binding subunit ClpB
MGLFGNKQKTIVTNRFDESIVPTEIEKLREQMAAKVAGQERAVEQFIRIQETIISGLTPTDRPLGVLLLVGPTGSGKTHVAEAFSEIQDVTLIKVDCAEFQQSHEIAKLIGAPPGYVGLEVPPRINKEAIEAKWATSKNKFTIILFDEIEKGNNALFQVLLGINDRGVMTTGKNATVDLKNCIIVMTSNLGSGEVKKLLQTRGGYGFGSGNIKADMDEDIYGAAKAAVKRFFSPEFFNRIDRMIVFRALTAETLRRILSIELERVQDRMFKANKFVSIELSERAKEFLLQEGTSAEYGARELRRTIERLLVSKITRAFTSKQAESGDAIVADKEPGTKGLTLDIAKGILDMPATPAPKPKEPTTEAIAKRPKAAKIPSEKPNASKPEQSTSNPEYCARCGWRWYEEHVCFDLLDGPLDMFRRRIKP